MPAMAVGLLGRDCAPTILELTTLQLLPAACEVPSCSILCELHSQKWVGKDSLLASAK